MRQIALLALLLAFAAAVYGQENILEKGLEGRSAADVISRRYVTPLRLVALPGELTAGVENPEALLRNFDGQLTTGTPDALMATGACSREEPQPKLRPPTMMSPSLTFGAKLSSMSTMQCLASSFGSNVLR